MRCGQDSAGKHLADATHLVPALARSAIELLHFYRSDSEKSAELGRHSCHDEKRDREQRLAVSLHSVPTTIVTHVSPRSSSKTPHV